MRLQQNIYAFLTALAFAALSSKAAEPARPPQLPSEVIKPVSIFDYTSPSVKDPFFPRSTRPPYVQQRHTDNNTPTAPQAEVKLVVKAISKGITGSTALINGSTFSEGEARFVKVPGGQVRIRCIKISERSVLINIEDRNEQMELRLQDK